MQLMKGQKGFLLLELMAAVFVLTVLCGGVVLQCDACRRAYYKRQVYLAACQLSGDLRRLQQDSVYGNYSAPAMVVRTAEEYMICKNTRVLESHGFSANGCSGVYFKAHLNQVSFGMDGAPTTSGKYVISHRQLPQCQYIVELQPVTGRVLVSERK